MEEREREDQVSKQSRSCHLYSGVFTFRAVVGRVQDAERNKAKHAGDVEDNGMLLGGKVLEESVCQVDGASDVL